ncbi:hypothetical protein D9M71_408270 [compost metagenome]
MGEIEADAAYRADEARIPQVQLDLLAAAAAHDVQVGVVQVSIEGEAFDDQVEAVVAVVEGHIGEGQPAVVDGDAADAAGPAALEVQGRAERTEGAEGAEALAATVHLDVVHHQHLGAGGVFDLQLAVLNVDRGTGRAGPAVGGTIAHIPQVQAAAVLAVADAAGRPALAGGLQADAALAADRGHGGVVQRLHGLGLGGEEHAEQQGGWAHGRFLSSSGRSARCPACGRCHRSSPRTGWSAGSRGCRRWRGCRPCFASRPGWPHRRRSCRS